MFLRSSLLRLLAAWLFVDVDVRAFLVIPETRTILLRKSHFRFDSLATRCTTSRLNSLQNDLSVDPLLRAVLTERASLLAIGGLRDTSNGIQVWRRALTKGRLPVDGDFDRVWPREPLFSRIYDTMVRLQLPRFSLYHPGSTSLILLSLLRMTIEFSSRIDQEENEIDYEFEMNDDVELFEEEIFEDESYLLDEASEDENQPVSLDFEETIADELCKKLFQEFGPVVQGVGILDGLFGYNNHDLLVESQPGGAPATGFGIQDGIWSHSGWQEIPKLQQQVANMPELKNLVRDLGKRPTAESGGRLQRFSPRKQHRDGVVGAEFDPQQKESVSGITLSSSLSEMLPSEAVLLCGPAALRRLFMAKKAESKLLSYELSGWTDVPSTPLTRPLYHSRLPSSPGGPIIVCLDTSYSMSGMRESLSKAVVLACISAASKQKRDCQVVAFSTESGIMESGAITADSAGIQRLLEFLSHSFGGGTDVTGALKFAMTSLESDTMSSSDILLVTDGEIPDPAVPDDVMQSLKRLKSYKSVEIHGLLIGKSESQPLSRICTHIHNFLSEYDATSIIKQLSTSNKRR